MTTTDQYPFIPPDQALRILHTLEIIGRAYLHGGLHVADTLPLAQQCEVGAALDHLAQFASLIDINRPQRHERPE
ncbi:hypothetical protein [Diaphorobacter sp.]|uniref:hypothetical protein n=1 Tax=Diaphorobacter sp. TaxID=1934310 RepID=UPI00258AEA71|nr:hypothetical protein [Diaphorobacter sp.]